MKPLYVLAVVGTARPNGVVSILAKKVLEGAGVSGHKTEFMNLYNYEINYYCGYWACETKGKCVLKDDFNLIFEKVKRADMFVLSAPTIA